MAARPIDAAEGHRLLLHFRGGVELDEVNEYLRALGVPGHQVGDTLVIGGRCPRELCLRSQLCWSSQRYGQILWIGRYLPQRPSPRTVPVALVCRDRVSICSLSRSAADWSAPS